MISFNSIPSGTRVPFNYVEIDNALANQGAQLLAYTGLLIGQKIAAGAGVANSINLIASEAQAIALGGRGSMIHRMVKQWLKNNAFTPLYVGVLADDGSGAFASGTLAYTGPATASGAVYLYLGGERITVGVSTGDSANTIAAAVNAAINANGDLPVTSTVNLATVTVTQRNKGVFGNEYDMRHNYQNGEGFPAGVGCVVTAMSGGTVNPVLTTLIAALGDKWFQVIGHPYTDATSLAAIEAEMSSRFGPTRMIDGVAFTAKQASALSTLTSLGLGRNSPHSCIAGQVGPLRPPMERAAMIAAVVANYASIDPARPFQTLPLIGDLAPNTDDEFTQAERNTCLFDGISTTKPQADGTVVIDRLITTYQTNGAGAPDVSYLDVTTMLTLVYLRWSFRTRIAQRYPRHKLADDAKRFGSGQAVMTPGIGKAEAVAWYTEMMELGLVESSDAALDAFKTNLVVERDATDRNRLNFLLPPDLINQLIATATKIQFRL